MGPVSATETLDEPTARIVDAQVRHALSEGIRLAEHGYQLSPVILARCAETGKKRSRHPIGWKTDASWSNDPEVIRDWSVQFSCSFGIRTGDVGGVDVIDLDAKDDKDAISWWAERGYPLSSMVVDTISGGLHLVGPACGLPTGTDVLAPGVDIRGNGGLVFAPGAFIPGEEGTYRVQGPMVKIADLQPFPAELVAAIKAASEPERVDYPADGRITMKDRDVATRLTKAAIEKVAAMPPPGTKLAGKNFRYAQMGAAMLLARFAEADGLDISWAREKVEAATLKVYPAGLSLDDHKNISSGLRDGPRKERWRWREPQAEDVDDQAAEDEEVELRAVERAVRERMRTLSINAEAQRRHDESRRPARRPIAERIVTFADLASIQPPRMLIKRLMPDRAVGFINGRSGAYKSFVLTAFAMAVGTGTPVMGHAEFQVARRGRVLYVAGEGSDGVALRLRAYAAAHGISEADVLLHREAINLASPGDVEELYGYAAATECSDVFVDTFRSNAVGVKENDSTEVGVVIAGAIRARDEHGVSTLYADHTGHAGERAVGAEAKWANVDYALMIHMPNGSRRADQQRTLRVEKFKDMETTGEWLIRLRSVPEVRDDDGNPSAVVELGEVDAASAVFDRDHTWWFDEVPEEIAAKFARKDGRTAALSLVRILRHVDDEDGLTSAQLAAVLKEGPASTSKTTFQAGLALLKKTAVAVQGRTPEKLVIAPEWGRS